MYVDFSGIPNVKIQTNYVLTHAVEFKEIMNTIFNSHRKQEEIQKLKIKSDPWDNYLYHDSTFLFQLVFNSNFYSTEDRFILLKLFLFIFYNDLMAHFKTDGILVGDKLINRVKHDPNFEEIYKFIGDNLYLKKEPVEEEIEKFETKLEVIFDLLITDLKSKNEISEFKDDYFKM